MRNTRTNEYGERTRRCTACNTWLLEVERNFGYSPRTGRWTARCKPCVSEYNRTRRAGTGGSARRNTLGNFGVEIEFHGARYAAAEALQSAGLIARVEDYNHRTCAGWKIVTDATVIDGGELVSPILHGENGLEQVRTACAALQAAGCTVSKQTGMHVHHDAQTLDRDAFLRLVQNWADCQTAIDGLVSRSRSDGSNGYTSSLTEQDIENIRAYIPRDVRLTKRAAYGLRRIGRYKALNVSAYPKYGTVEIRQHQGTLNGTKATAWVSFGQAMLKAAIAGATYATTDTAALLRWLNDWGYLNNDDRRYLEHRSETLAAQRTAA